MPWINFENLSNDEAHAIFTYLKSIKLGKNIVPAVVSPNKMYNALSKTVTNCIFRCFFYICEGCFNKKKHKTSLLHLCRQPITSYS
ncbi:MAG: hypothetical protein IPH56_08630 [Chitinophagaceae bacterium]|nr:hypothetical protein [Chitinophagaceae bacterium]